MADPGHTPICARPDCRRFVGEKPCEPFKECTDCSDYDPMGTRILIIKLGAGGDVLRTAAILPGLKKKYPQSHITWITLSEHLPLLNNHGLIDRLLPLDALSILVVSTEKFGVAINLDKIPPANALMEQLKADQKYGFGMDKFGSLRSLTPHSDYAYRLGISDQLKFKENTKTYPQIIYEMCDLPYQGEKYQIYLTKHQQGTIRKLRAHFKADAQLLLGLNTGSGPVFRTKRWQQKRWLELAALLHHSLSVRLALLGGPEEAERNKNIIQEATIPMVDTGTDNSLSDFITLVGAMDGIVTSDTLAMHIALALDKKVIVLLGPTSDVEIDLFGQGLKIVSDFDCSPCYLKDCDKKPTCMDSLPAQVVAQAVHQVFTSQ